MMIQLDRVYNDKHCPGYRVLVDRLWPRGIAREKAGLDEWCKDLAPSAELRKWFNHDVERWPEFQKRYTKELSAQKAEIQALLKRAGRKKLVLVFGAKDEEHNQAVVLQKFLEKLAA